ncbi:Asp/Glu racemase [Gordonia sp. X0973]|uniref:aspartate/glutamate racemase family protein n=1 Tax=Gordonia sp. X0973 TaxID=2742602 RepID=UPI000F51FCD0|nr:aspartate/glutamate racemase family protein [Gordonia sp. X0973]QKT07683.1 Asp/Glu racemase [Gordonia sp. X0973]
MANENGRRRITVVNADDNEPIRQRILYSIKPLIFDDGPEIEVVTLPGGPKLMETQEDIDSVGPPMTEFVGSKPDTDVFVVVCFADPGLAEARKAAGGRKVFGINQCGINTALALGDKVGVIGISDAAVARHHRYYESLGIGHRIAGERPANIDLGDAANALDPTTAIDPKMVLDRLAEVSRELIEDGADVIVLGEGGMSPARDLLQEAIGIPVVDPTAAAVGMAIVAASVFPMPHGATST